MASKTNRARKTALTKDRDKSSFSIFVRLFTNEKFPLKNITNDMKVSFLTTQTSEAMTLSQVFRLGVTQPTSYHTPGSDYMTKRARKAWLQERAFLALYVASHRGHENLVRKLIESGADVNASTPLGRTALHVAASQGHGHIVDLLLEHGADIDAEDDRGQTALTIAASFGHKTCERHLFLFRWQQRAKRTKPSKEPARMAHQYYDSALPVWKKGGKCQLYFMNILPPGEYEGTRFGSPKRMKDLTAEELEELEAIGTDGKLPAIREGKKQRAKSGPARLGKRGGLSYDEWLGRKLSFEQKIIDEKRGVQERKKFEEDERKRQEAEKSESYETWLANKETEKRVVPAGPVTAPIQGPPATTSIPRQPEMDTSDRSQEMSRADGYLRTYLKSLDERKRGNSYFSYENWLDEKEETILGLRRQKTTFAN
ncbi:ANR60-like protein [Mya arenaria]|uniref:ANR60-like protein n=1 Tax=Mya arenaria TaxID=6604 RepID=A0ABY7ESR3_MYAAR|nr:ANR60-like protein [Mya arenaria]